MIWSGAFLLLFLLLSAFSFIQFIVLKKYYRKNPPAFSLPTYVNSGETFSVPIEMKIPLIFPGFRIKWSCFYIWEEGHRSIHTSQVLSRSELLTTFHFPSLKRGVYKGNSGTLLLEDIFGFTTFKLFQGEPLTLYVYPSRDGEDFERDIILSGGSTATDARERIRSDELLEVRKYYPGDDARRINWKMYAASGEMFLRMGEEIPPPSGEATVCLFSNSELIASSKNSADQCDRMISLFLSLVQRFLEKGCTVQALVSSSSGKILYEPDKPDRLFRELASISPSQNPIKLPEDDFFYALSFPGASELHTLLEQSRKEAGLFLLSTHKPLPLFQNYEFIFKRNGSILHLVRDGKESRKYREAAETWLNLIKKNGKGRIHARLV